MHWVISSRFLPFRARKLRSKLGFSRFSGLFIAGSKTKSAVCCEVWYGEQRKRSIIKGSENSLEGSVDLVCRKCLFADSIFTTNISHNTSILGALTYFPPIIRHKLMKWPLTPPFWAQDADGPSRIFRWKNDWYARKKLRTSLGMVLGVKKNFFSPSVLL